MTEQWKLYAFEQPQKLRAGSIGSLERFFDCGECLTKEPEFYGFIAQAPSYDDVLIWRKGELLYAAFLCKTCCEKYELHIDKTVTKEKK